MKKSFTHQCNADLLPNMVIAKQASKPTLGREIQLLRTQRGLSQHELVRRLGYSSSAWLSRLESSDRTPSRDQLLQIATALQLTDLESDQLLSSAGYASKPPPYEELRNLIAQVSALITQLDELRSNIVPRPPRVSMPDPLDTFVAHATELWIAGATLQSLSRRFSEFLRNRLQQGMQLKVVFTSPRLTSRSLVIKELSDRRGYAHAPMRQEIRATLNLMRDLITLCSDEAQLQVYGYSSVMRFGLVIVNPFSPEVKARLALYFDDYLAESNPVVDFHRAVPGEASYIDACIDYFKALVRRSHPIPL